MKSRANSFELEEVFVGRHLSARAYLPVSVLLILTFWILDVFVPMDVIYYVDTPLLHPATGIGMAALTMLGLRYTPIVFIAIVFVTLSDLPMLATNNTLPLIGRALSGTLDALLGAWLLRHVLDFSPTLSRIKDAVNVTLIAIPLTTWLDPTLGTLVFLYSDVIEVSQAIYVWSNWWLSHFTATIIYTPFLMVCLLRPNWKVLKQRWGEILLLLIALGVLSWLVFLADIPSIYQLAMANITLPLIVWAALRFGIRGCIFLSSAVIAIGTLATASGLGPMAVLPVEERWPAYFIFASALTTMTIFLGALTATQKREAIALQTGERELQELLKNVRVGLMILQDGLVIYSNPEFVHMMGYSSLDELKEKGRMRRHFARPAWRQIVERYAALVRLKATPDRYEIEAITRNGDVLWMDVSIASYSWHGKPATLIGALDVTDRKKAEGALAQVQKLDSIGQLTGGVAHDFNNLLSIIMGNLDLYNEGENGDNTTNRYIEQAIAAAERGADLTRRLLTFARQQTLNPDIVDVNTLIAEFLSMVRQSMGNLIIIEERLADTIWPLRIDSGQFENALLNLCINARDAMPSGGTISISTSNHTVDPTDMMVAQDVEPGDYVCITVTDTGVGIEQQNLTKIFEPFYTTKGRSEGSGMGLSMVYGFIRQSGGHVSATSAKGQGTTFKLYLPRYIA